MSTWMTCLRPGEVSGSKSNAASSLPSFPCRSRGNFPVCASIDLADAGSFLLVTLSQFSRNNSPPTNTKAKFGRLSNGLQAYLTYVRVPTWTVPA